MDELLLLHRLLTNGITACSHMTSNSQKASVLLGEIYRLLLEVDTLGKENVQKVGN